MSEQFKNGASSTLATAISAGNTTLTVATGEGARFPTTGNFRLLIGSEILLATARTGDDITVTRGAESTTAASHAVGAPVTEVLTAGALAATIADGTTGMLTGGTPAIVLGTAAAPGTATTGVRTDATLDAFDASAPTTSAPGDSASAGSVAKAARRDHAHGRENFVTPAIALGTSAVQGSANALIRGDATIAAFDNTNPSFSGVGDVAATGSQARAARRDHVHSRESFATPAIVLGTAAAAGGATTPIRSDSTIVAFDATNPVTQAYNDTPATGAAAVAARRDHKHGMPASGGASGGTPAVVLGTAAAAGSAGTFLRDDDTIVAFDATAPTTSAVADAAAVGSVALAARRDHLHGRESFGSPTSSTAALAAGSATTPARSDHSHNMFVVRKTADETVNNSATLQNDDHLSFSIAANEIYWVETFLRVTSLSTASDFKAGWTVPAAATMAWGTLGSSSAALATFGAWSTTQTAVALLSESGTAQSGSGVVTWGIAYAGWVYGGANAGTVQFQWAQNTATAEDTKVLQNSFMRVTRIA